MKPILCAALLVTLRLISQAAADQPPAKATPREEVKSLGTVEIAVEPAAIAEPRQRRYQGSVLFQFPADDGLSYRVDVVISKPNGMPTIDSKRIDMWLLAKDSKVVTVKDRPRNGPLIEVNSAGASASAIYFFNRDVPRDHLVAVMVSIDGKLQTFKVPLAK